MHEDFFLDTKTTLLSKRNLLMIMILIEDENTIENIYKLSIA